MQGRAPQAGAALQHYMLPPAWRQTRRSWPSHCVSFERLYCWTAEHGQSGPVADCPLIIYGNTTAEACAGGPFTILLCTIGLAGWHCPGSLMGKQGGASYALLSLTFRPPATTLPG